jgi:hypothetical protein
MEDGAKFCPSCGTPAGGAAPAPKPATEKVGNIRKCPACGAEAPSMAAVCPECGHEFSNVKIVSSVQTFFEKLDNLSEADFADSNVLSSGRSIRQSALAIAIKQGGAVLWFYVFYMLIGLAAFPLLTLYVSKSMIAIIASIVATVVLEFCVMLLWRAKGPKWTSADLRKQNYIEVFPIPNAKEDLLEFVILASNMIKPGGTKWTGKGKIILKWNEIWRAKCKQVYFKAAVSLASDAQALATIQNLMKQAGIAV